MSDAPKKELSQGLKMALDFAPLVAFFAAYKFGGMYVATATLMAATLVAVFGSYILTGKIAKFPLGSAVLVGIMGGLTLYLQNDTFFKMKPTIANLAFAGVLGFGLYTERMFLRDLLGTAFEMPQAAWRNLTWRWTGFFLALAALNEGVWRNFPESTWVNFKVFGLMGLTMLFAIANTPFMMKHMVEKPENPSAD